MLQPNKFKNIADFGPPCKDNWYGTDEIRMLLIYAGILTVTQSVLAAK